MFNVLEATTKYNDSWNLTFYYILVLVILVAIFWTYLQVFVKGKGRKKNPNNQNLIYQNSEDTIEENSNQYNLKKINKTRNGTKKHF